MKIKKSIVFSFLTVFLLLFSTSTASAMVTWGKTELKKGQIGKVTIVTNVNAVKLSGSTLIQDKRLKKGEEYRVYSYKKMGDSYYYGLGGSLFVKKSKSIKYETPSKAKLSLLQWEKVKPNLNLPDYAERTIQLKDGRVMIISREENNKGSFIYDYKTNKWSKAAPTIKEYSSSPILLKDGRVLVLSGDYDYDFSGDGLYTNAEIYNPKTNKWSVTGNLKIRRGDFVRAVELDNGKVMIAGGTHFDRGDIEIYDPKTNKWSKEVDMKYYSSNSFAFLPLKDGRVLSVGGDFNLGLDRYGYMEKATVLEIYDDKTNTWTVHAIDAKFNVTEKIFYLSDGTIFINGHYNNSVYNLETEVFKPLMDISQSDAVEMQNGKVLITGVNPKNYNQPKGYIYSLKTKKLESIAIPSNSPTLFMLPNGKVLALSSTNWVLENGWPISGSRDGNVMYLYTHAE